MKIGFIGTKYGMSIEQLESVIELIIPISKQDVEVHYSNHSTSDAQFHRMVCNFLLCKCIYLHQIEGKQNIDECFENTCNAVILPAMPFYETRKSIIDQCDLLILAPKQDYECEEHNSVLQALQIAQKKNKDIKIVQYDGLIDIWPNEKHIPKKLRKKKD